MAWPFILFQSSDRWLIILWLSPFCWRSKVQFSNLLINSLPPHQQKKWRDKRSPKPLLPSSLIFFFSRHINLCSRLSPPKTLLVCISLCLAFFCLWLLSSFFNFDYFSSTVAIVCQLHSICQKDSSKEVFMMLTYEEKKHIPWYYLFFQ